MSKIVNDLESYLKRSQISSQDLMRIRFKKKPDVKYVIFKKRRRIKGTVARDFLPLFFS
jgi:hypothetical protein